MATSETVLSSGTVCPALVRISRLDQLRQLSIPGLFLAYEYISPIEEQILVTFLDSKIWSTELKRRQQFYGYEYKAKSKSLKTTTPLEGPLVSLAECLKLDNVLNANQCIVNEYTRKTGIGAHIDADNVGEIVAGISLGDPTNMIFTRDGYSPVSVYIPPRSLIIMTGESRWLWKHEIPATVSYTEYYGNKVLKRDNYRRISITYRMIPNSAFGIPMNSMFLPK